MSGKWTPGPWVTHGHNVYFTKNGKAAGPVCMALYRQEPENQKETANANAHLIAAAPELVEALEEVLDSIGALTNPNELHSLIGDRADSVFAALRKARGETE